MTTLRKRLPPLQNLEAFEAAARHLSFTKAANEINLSQSAVSRQIKHLEESMDVHLFTRSHKTITLTKAGRTLLSGIERCLAELRRTVETIESDKGPTVTISASMAIASFWLLPCIAEFRAKHPEIKVRVVAGDGDEYTALLNNETDFTIIYDHRKRSDLISIELFEEVIFPACTPAYLAHRKIDSVEQLSKEHLIDFEVKHLRTVKNWPDWFRRAGCETRGIHYTISVSNYDLACRAAHSGQGVMLMWAYVAPLLALKAGTLIRPVKETVNTGYFESLVFSRQFEDSVPHQIFKEWLLSYACRTNKTTKSYLGN